MAMDSEDYGSDGFNPYEAEADSDPTVALGEGLLTDEEEPQEEDPLAAREALINQKAQKVEKAIEQQANLHGMEAYYNQQQQIHNARFLARGLAPQRAAELAQEATHQDMQTSAKDLINRRMSQRLVAQETGLDPSLFKDLWTENEMRQRANQVSLLNTPEGQQMYQQWAQMQMQRNRLQQQGVPAQSFNRPSRTNGGNNPARLRQQYADGLIGLTPAVQKAING